MPEMSYFIRMACSLLLLRFISCQRNRLNVVKAKKYQLRGKKWLKKGSKFHQNGSFDFWTSCPKINRNPLLSLQSCTSTSKYLFYLLWWDLFSIFICVFGSNWRTSRSAQSFLDTYVLLAEFAGRTVNYFPRFSTDKSPLFTVRTEKTR